MVLFMSSKPRVLILADDCNPEWPSLPVVGYKYARSLMRVTDATLVTHVRNRENIEKAGELGDRVHYIDNEWIASPMYRLSVWLRRGDQVAWSIQQMMSYLPYLEFERRALRDFKKQLRGGAFDIVHRITPMSPTRPSYMAGRCHVPFMLGPLNGNLNWPAAFRSEQAREKEKLRFLRGAYSYLPFARSTFRKASAVLGAFKHTIDDLTYADPKKIVPMPEIGIDMEIFNTKGRTKPFSGPGPYKFLYAGRLVPYKLPEAAVRAFVASEAMKAHSLEVIGTGPEEDSLRKIVADAGAEDRVTFSGLKSQAEVAQAMRAADAFVFPSIRELGAGVVIEAMASGPVCIVADYGAPGDLVANGRGVALPLQPLEALTKSLQAAMEGCVNDPEAHAALADKAEAYATSYFEWDTKAEYTADIYRAVIDGQPVEGFKAYL